MSNINRSNDVERIGWDFAAVMKRVEAGDEVEITINGKPEAVIISYAEYERLRAGGF